jgi:hypothetical protein
MSRYRDLFLVSQYVGVLAYRKEFVLLLTDHSTR